MCSPLLAEAGVFNRLMESQSLIVVIVIMIVGFLFMRATKSRNDAMTGDALKDLRGDTMQQDLFQWALAAVIVWFLSPIIPFKSPLEPTKAVAVTVSQPAANQPAATTATGTATTVTPPAATTATATPAATTATPAATTTATMKDFPATLLPQIVWKGDTVTFPTATPDASLGIGQFWVIAFKPSSNEAISWMKGYKLKTGNVYTLPSGVTDVRVYADSEGIGVRTYPETLTKTP